MDLRSVFSPRPAHPRYRRTASALLGLTMAAALTALPATPSLAAPQAATGPLLSYFVNTYPGHAAALVAEQQIAQAGGTVVHSYEQIGVVVAHSDNPAFAGTLRATRLFDSVGATRTAPLAPALESNPVGLSAEEAAAADSAADAGQEPLEPLQWDIGAIKADQAHAVSLGSRRVLVGVIDTGVDDTHPDLAPNFDAADSVSCVSGAPDTTPGAWRPTAGAPGYYHGTHVAGTIAAARNGIGVTGVAPGVRLAAIKVSEPTKSAFYPESVVCGFVWAAEHHVDITNNSYYIDPWYFNCLDGLDQQAAREAVRRAAGYATDRGTLHVASAGNKNWDLAARSITDTYSPNDGTPVNREVDPRKCLAVPSGLPGVVTVAATGALNLKSSYSNYGQTVIDVAAPGGDWTFYQPPQAPAVSGGILSTMPDGDYGHLNGTSMASPHVAGVAALLKSTHPDAPPHQIAKMLEQQADALSCPVPYDIDGNAVCQGGRPYNGFYGHGLVNALRAVTR
ncbi:S8 family peptidase [Streptomyces sp. NBC_01618]|uniref:S8 family peptidase n=1 Tax=Streptomyces sp. NBC_01618 TaxID=2975900 RepID=UPI00386CF447|nr:S8 family serine peptidase [Streptomyces sp. NBC_01618]